MMNVKRILWLLALCVGLLSGAAEAAIVYETVQPLPQKEAGDKAAVEWQRERQLQAMRLKLLPQAQEKLRAALPDEVRAALSPQQLRAFTLNQLRAEWQPATTGKTEPGVRVVLADDGIAGLRLLLQQPDTSRFLLFYELASLQNYERLTNDWADDAALQALPAAERERVERERRAAVAFDKAVYARNSEGYRILPLLVDWQAWSAEIVLSVLNGGGSNPFNWERDAEKRLEKYFKPSLSIQYSMMKEARKAAELQPLAAQRMLLAECESSFGKSDADLVALMDAAVSEQPNEPYYYLERAAILTKMSPREYYWSAEADYARAMRLLPELKGILLGRGLLRGLVGRQEAAIADFDAYFSVRGGAGMLAPLQLAYALYLDRLGRQGQAATQYQAFLAAAEKGSALANLAQLRWNHLNRSSLAQ